MTTTIQMYPPCIMPEWLKVGVKVKCLGEANDIFTVDDIDENKSAVYLIDECGFDHGWESITKIYRP